MERNKEVFPVQRPDRRGKRLTKTIEKLEEFNDILQQQKGKKDAEKPAN